MAESFSIALSGTVSTGALLIGRGRALVALEFPAAMTGTKVTLKGSIDGANYLSIYMDNTIQEVTFNASTMRSINPRATYGLHSVKIESDAAEAEARTFPAVVDEVV
jgi:hypothetical protein